MRQLSILYDGVCSLCRRVKGWLERQRSYVPLELMALDGATARARYPELDPEDCRKELTVVADERWVYRGHKAWLMCLWALEGFRPWALRLGAPGLEHVARRAIEIISYKRYPLSNILRETPPPAREGACP